MKNFLILILTILFYSSQLNAQEKKMETNNQIITKQMQNGNEIATFAGGCFWCTEALFLNLKGVVSVTSGYTGGKTLNPTYREVCSGETGHAEGTQIVFDPKQISFNELLEVFFSTHDPTTLNRQGADVGTQYRSAVFFHSDSQKIDVENYLALLEKENTFGSGKKIVTQIQPATVFYVAEDYHQNYYNQNKQEGYCSYVITPKVEKLKKQFKSKLKN